MKVIFSKYAKLELDDATHYYELEYPEAWFGPEAPAWTVERSH